MNRRIDSLPFELVESTKLYTLEVTEILTDILATSLRAYINPAIEEDFPNYQNLKEVISKR